MSSNPLRLKYLFARYISNDCTKRELKEFWQLFSELSENDLIIDDIQALWDYKSRRSDPSQAVNWSRIRLRLKEKANEHDFDYTFKAVSHRKRLQKIAVAATALFCIALPALWLLPKNRTAQKAYAKTVAKPSGHQVIILPDGTTVTLNLSTKLGYPAAFSGSTRDVYLTGEAYFEVKNNTSQPFLVHTGNFVTRVLGTTFNIKAYPDDNDLAVTVTRGKVQVQKSGDKKSLGVLLPGDQLVIDKNSEHSVMAKTDIQKVVEWRAEDLVFDNINLDEAAVLIGNRYGTEVRFKSDDLRNDRITAAFSSDDGYSQVMDVICMLAKASWHKEGDKLIWIERKERK